MSMGNVIQFPARKAASAQSGAIGAESRAAMRSNVRSSFRLDDPEYRAYCFLRDEVAKARCLPYATRFEHADAWEALLAKDGTERELERLSKIVNPTGRLRGI